MDKIQYQWPFSIANCLFTRPGNIGMFTPFSWQSGSFSPCNISVSAFHQWFQRQDFFPQERSGVQLDRLHGFYVCLYVSPNVFLGEMTENHGTHQTVNNCCVSSCLEIYVFVGHKYSLLTKDECHC